MDAHETVSDTAAETAAQAFRPNPYLVNIAAWQRYAARNAGRRLLRRLGSNDVDDSQRQRDAARAAALLQTGLKPVRDVLDTAVATRLLGEIAIASIIAGHYAAAEECAAELERASHAWTDTDALPLRSAMLEQSATIRGECCLGQGDVEGALVYLTRSCCNPPSDSSSTIGPELRLAMALADRGHYAPVIEYLRHYLEPLPALNRRALASIVEDLERRAAETR